MPTDQESGHWAGRGWRRYGDTIVGTCKLCNREFPAVGLVGMVKGYVCSKCRPDLFGRINGKPTRGIPMDPIGAATGPKKTKLNKKVADIMQLAAILGTTLTEEQARVERAATAKANRKMRPMPPIRFK